MLAGYCAGWSLRALLTEGLNGVSGKAGTQSPFTNLPWTKPVPKICAIYAGSTDHLRKIRYTFSMHLI
jgi:hypothetical protein